MGECKYLSAYVSELDYIHMNYVIHFSVSHSVKCCHFICIYSLIPPSVHNNTLSHIEFDLIRNLVFAFLFYLVLWLMCYVLYARIVRMP